MPARPVSAVGTTSTSTSNVGVFETPPTQHHKTVRFLEDLSTHNHHQDHDHNHHKDHDHHHNHNHNNNGVEATSRASTITLQQNTTEHQLHERPPLRPIWCALVTRVVSMNSTEARCDGARDAVMKERDGLLERNTFDMQNPREIDDVMRDPKIEEAMFGRVFVILGIRNAEGPESDQSWKGRAVFQGNDIRTKSGVDAAQLFQEIASSPASFVASRAALATAALRRMDTTFRDALQAYLQARIDGEGRAPTFAELPRAWWPNSWFHDGPKRTQPKFRRPVVQMFLALYGHPESGPLWDHVLEGALTSSDFSAVPDWPGVWVHASDGTIIVVYVDDIMMTAITASMVRHWHNIEKARRRSSSRRARRRSAGS